MQITDHIHALKIPFQLPVGPGKMLARFVYVYLVMGREICLIDSGVQNSSGIIFNYLKKIGREPEEISLLALTHAHPDHIGSAGEIKEATGCTVAAHPDAKAWIEDVELQCKERPVPGFHTLADRGTPLDRLLQDGERIDLGPLSLQVILTPGHASGALSFYCQEEGVLFSGDAIPLPNGLPIYDDAAATAASVKRLKDLQPIKHLLASWADPVAGAAVYEMMNGSLDYLQRIHAIIRDIAAESRVDDPMELCRRVGKVLGLPETAVNPLVAQSFVSHLKSDGSVKNLILSNGAG